MPTLPIMPFRCWCGSLEALADGEPGQSRYGRRHGGYLTRALNNEVDEEAAQSEYGLTIFCIAGSAAPFVGLFGTVWGVYHALVHIGFSGQGTLDKVAGPVGEALIMTAPGLAVAIPAVLAYNAFYAQPAVAGPARRLCPRPLRAAHGDDRQAPRVALAGAPHGLWQLRRAATNADGGHQHGAADRRDAGAAGDLHRHRAAAHPRGEDRPAQGVEPAPTSPSRTTSSSASCGKRRIVLERRDRSRSTTSAAAFRRARRASRSRNCTSAPTGDSPYENVAKVMSCGRQGRPGGIGFVSDPSQQ